MAFSYIISSSRLQSPLLVAKFTSIYTNANKNRMKIKENAVHSSKGIFRCTVQMASEHSEEPNKLSFENLWNKAKTTWETSPKPIKYFPWNKAFESFIQLVLDLTVSVVKYLCVPILTVSSVSEMSYCAHERRLALVPFPLIIGLVFAGILQKTALDITPRLKDAEVPWHLIATAIFFTLLKLPGPYYPYWGRLIVPHFVNGVLWKTLWSLFFWYKRPRTASESPLRNNNVEAN